MVMAQEWCERMQYFWSLRCGAGDANLVFGQAALDRYVETPQFAQLANIVNKPSQQQEVVALRALCPS